MAPAVTHAEAIAHANSNLPAPETELASTLTGYVSSSPSFLATRTAGDAETCWQYFTGELEVIKPDTGNGYLVQIAENSVIGSDDAPVYGTCNTENCSDEGTGLESYAKVVKDGKVTFIQKEKDTFSLTTSEVIDGGDTYPAGSVKVTVVDLLGNMGGDFVEHFGFKNEDETGYYALGDIKSYFPYTDIGSVTVDVTFSKDGSISGSVVDDSINMDLTDYVSSSNYTLVKSRSGCTYSISKAPTL